MGGIDLHPRALAGGCDKNMDKTIKITLGVFIVILVAFAATAGYAAYVENAYRTSLSSTYSYTCTITTDSTLTNVTLFIPVPADLSGNSPLVSEFSAHRIHGVPASWTTDLYDTGKATLVKITTSSLVPPAGTTPDKPYTLTLYANTSSRTPIDTENPVENSAMYRPVQHIGTADPGYTYTTSVFADYQAAPGTIVTIDSSLIGKNEWKIFESRQNEYRTGISVRMSGNQKEWTDANGYLEAGIGSYDAPVLHT